MIVATDLTKAYGAVLANDHINLQVNPGEITVLLGPNGAGKSSLIKCVCGLLRFTGMVSIDGFDCRSLEAKRRLAYVPELPAPYPMLTVDEHMEFIARAYRLENWRERADDLLWRFELTDLKKKLGKELSKGMQQKVSICTALLPDPTTLVLDEPLVGLDPHAIRELKSILLELRAAGRTILLSTHIIESVEESWDVTFIMINGKIVYEVRRGAGKLEDIYFAITEGSNANSPAAPTVAS
ncbi:MAG: ABC transporter ATP-binding protein [Coriobacteriia bacterium]|nr:ABC transporter ATP-binding protein [Coriobacteriia bacterium]